MVIASLVWSVACGSIVNHNRNTFSITPSFFFDTALSFEAWETHRYLKNRLGIVCMYRGRPSWNCPWEGAIQLGQGEGPIGIVGPISQPRRTNGTASLTLERTSAP